MFFPIFYFVYLFFFVLFYFFFFIFSFFITIPFSIFLPSLFVFLSVVYFLCLLLYSVIFFYFSPFSSSAISSLIGKQSAAAEEMTTVRIIVLVPFWRSEIKGRIEEARLMAKERATRPARILFFLAGGIITERNIPYRATLNALTAREGSRFPAMIPSDVPVASKERLSLRPHKYNMDLYILFSLS